MLSQIKYGLIVIVSFWCVTLKAGDVLSLRQANGLKQEGEESYYAKDYNMAIKKLEQASSAFKKFGKVVERLSCMEFLCESYEELGLIDEAITTKEEQVEIHASIYSTNDSNYAVLLIELAHLFGLKGDYIRAIDLSKEALDIRGNVYGEESKEYATVLNNIAFYYSHLGDLDVATSYMSKAMSIVEKHEGKESVSYANSLMVMAGACFSMLQFDWALEVGTKIVDILSKHQDSEDYYVALQNLALYKYKSNENLISESIELTKKALELQRRKKKENSPFYGIGLCNLMTYYIELSRYDEAEKNGLEALALYNKLYNQYHPNITTLLTNLSALYVNSGQEDAAIEYISKATEGYYYQTTNTFKYLTKQERTHYWLKYELWCENQLPTYALKLKNDIVSGYAYDATLFSKGLLLNSDREIAEIIKESDDSILIQDYNDLQQLNGTINYYSQVPSNMLGVNIDSLKTLANEKEKVLISRSYAYGDFTKNLNIRWQDVQAKLDSLDIAVEFLSLPYYEEGNTYIALLLKKDWKLPKLVKINFNDSIVSNDYSYLSNCIWKPLLQDLHGVKNVFFAPSGKLNSFPIESFPMPDDTIFISDKYNLFRLSSTRELAVQNHNSKGVNAVLYGGLIFNTDISELENDSKNYRIAMDDGKKTRSIVDDKTVNGIREWASDLIELPGTKKEVEQIGMIMRSTNLDSLIVDDYIGNKGTEISFKSLSGKKKKIIHIGTHGFYLIDDTNKSIENLSMATTTMEQNVNDVRSLEDKSLSRCGLCFAGASNKLQGKVLPEGLDDGILTAQEISTLDLRGLDMVSLSACQTAQGDIMSDGVFGLQRGFKKAGAKSILMSLWNVNDDATCLLMTEFYKNWIGKGKSKHQALELAKQEVRSRKGWEDPKYWAAFILLDGLD